MTFLIDKFFIEEFNNTYHTNLDYKEFVIFHKAVRAKKNSLGLVKKSSFQISFEEMQEYKKLFPELFN